MNGTSGSRPGSVRFDGSLSGAGFGTGLSGKAGPGTGKAEVYLGSTGSHLIEAVTCRALLQSEAWPDGYTLPAKKDRYPLSAFGR